MNNALSILGFVELGGIATIIILLLSFNKTLRNQIDSQSKILEGYSGFFHSVKAIQDMYERMYDKELPDKYLEMKKEQMEYDIQKKWPDTVKVTMNMHPSKNVQDLTEELYAFSISMIKTNVKDEDIETLVNNWFPKSAKSIFSSLDATEVENGQITKLQLISE